MKQNRRGPKVLKGSDRTIPITIRPSLAYISKKTGIPLKKVFVLEKTPQGIKQIMAAFRGAIYSEQPNIQPSTPECYLCGERPIEIENLCKECYSKE